MKIILTLIILLLSKTAYANESVISATVLRIIDGDTIEVKAHPWPGFNPVIKIRLLAIDTPELKGKCPQEKKLAIQAKEYLTSITPSSVMLHEVQYGKYAGRLLAEIHADDINLSNALIEKGYARAYDGGQRQGWCP
ncbi:MAG: nuclease [Magnetococcales bacterium]|nr:nuclease [Magnetococcales bacterium]|tara:strand:+ start:27535 stop:27945 length:411 start_codon:yes stop_codon:yes gene_type:complete